ncbi:MAG: gliding motility-associated C-terminal domain-containing protein [Bacteroidales bacterium]|nr:gliding motility-associated C-terminal domain-containing protein [Bacteroidales bacterium]
MKLINSTIIIFILFLISISTSVAQNNKTVAKLAPGNALEFDGVDDNIEFSILPITSSVYTISAWVKPNVLVGAHQIVSAGHTTIFNQAIQFRLDGEQLEFGANIGSSTLNKITGDVPLNLNRWNHVAVVFNNSNVTLYVNGHNAGTGTVDMTGLNVDIFHIGAKIDALGGMMFFDGEIDEICIWSSALSETQLRDVMYTELVGNESNLEAYFNFNATSGTLLEDLTSNSYDGTLTNMSNVWIESYALVVPETLPATNNQQESFTANWLIPVTGTADGYFLDVSTDSLFNSFVVERQNVTANSFEVTGLHSGTKYFYRVCAYKSILGDIGAWHYNAPIIAYTDPATLVPNTQAQGIVVSNITNYGATLDWTRGDGERCVVFVLEGNSGQPAPVNEVAYTANSEFAMGDEIPETGWYCVYNGTETNVVLTSLNSTMEYRAMVIEYNDGVTNEKYLNVTSTNNPVNFTTLTFDEVIVSNFVSPDGNGKNDVLVIQGLEILSEYQFYILNSNGAIIYQTDNYDNSWNATYNGNELPNGTYYYIITDGNISQKGTITVIR